MAKFHYEGGFLLSQDLLFGLKPEILVPRLTTRNWKKSALANLREGQRVYTYVEKRKLVPDLGGGYVYSLSAHDLDTNKYFGPFHWDFPTLKEALAEANKGEPIDPSLLERRYAMATIVCVPKRKIPAIATALED